MSLNNILINLCNGLTRNLVKSRALISQQRRNFKLTQSKSKFEHLPKQNTENISRLQI